MRTLRVKTSIQVFWLKSCEAAWPNTAATVKRPKSATSSVVPNSWVGALAITRSLLLDTATPRKTPPADIIRKRPPANSTTA